MKELETSAKTAADEAKTALDTLTAEKEELAKRVDELEASARTSADEAQTSLNTAIAEKDELARKLVDAADPSKLDFSQLDAKGLTSLVDNLKKAAEKLGYKLDLTQE